eukprot:RCo007893
MGCTNSRVGQHTLQPEARAGPKPETQQRVYGPAAHQLAENGGAGSPVNSHAGAGTTPTRCDASLPQVPLGPLPGEVPAPAGPVRGPSSQPLSKCQQPACCMVPVRALAQFIASVEAAGREQLKQAQVEGWELLKQVAQTAAAAVESSPVATRSLPHGSEGAAGSPLFFEGIPPGTVKERLCQLAASLLGVPPAAAETETDD